MTRFPRAPIAVAAAVLVLGAAACSSEGDDASEDTSTTLSATLTEDPRYECEDATGDLEDVYAPVGSTALSEPAGIDLVDAVVDRTDDALDVEFTAAGDIDATTTAPAFILFRGQAAATQGSFEVQALRDDDGTWALYVIEYLTNVGERRRLDAPVTVEADTLRFTVPLASLPPVTGTVAWSFGTFDGDRSSVTDLDAPTTTEAPSDEPPEAPPERRGISDLCSPFDEGAAAAATTTAG